MAAGKARTKGPISKALAGKLSIGQAMRDVEQNYRNGVGSAANAWVKGELDYLKYYVPMIKEYVNNDSTFKNSLSDNRIRLALKKTSELAKAYDAQRARKINDEIINAYGTGTVGTEYSSGYMESLQTSSKNVRSGKAIRI